MEEEGKVLLTSKEGGTIGLLAEESDAKYKDACTRFQRLSTDGNYSLVRCMPQTGRTHQVRCWQKGQDIICILFQKITVIMSVS